jgi:hypothetical protein
VFTTFNKSASGDVINASPPNPLLDANELVNELEAVGGQAEEEQEDDDDAELLAAGIVFICMMATLRRSLRPMDWGADERRLSVLKEAWRISLISALE